MRSHWFVRAGADRIERAAATDFTSRDDAGGMRLAREATFLLPFR